jgi:hypothetical protein
MFCHILNIKKLSIGHFFFCSGKNYLAEMRFSSLLSPVKLLIKYAICLNSYVFLHFLYCVILSEKSCGYHLNSTLR